MHTTSASLLDRLRDPAEWQAWARFVQLYTPLLVHWARRLGLSDEDAEDLVQDVFTLLVQKLPEFTYDRSRSFRGWLSTVLRNKWRDRERRQMPELRQSQDERGPEPAIPDAITAYWENEYRQHLVGRALEVMRAEFTPTTWRACWEFVACGRPAAEVAAELQITENAVYIAKCRVLRRLRQELEGLVD